MKFPTATQVLRFHGFYDDMDAAGAANIVVGQNRGSAVHSCCHWLGMGLEPRWKEGRTHPELDRYLDGYRLFLREHKWVMEAHEAEFVSDTERLASHPDQLGYLDGDESCTDLEIKTGEPPNWVNLQTSLQVLTMDKHLAVKRFCLSLPGNGKYRLIPHVDVRDFAEARVLVQAMWTRAKYQGEFWNKEES